MRWPAPVSFRAQAFIIGAASFAVFALAALIVQDVIFTTEGRLLDDALQRCKAACRELKIQYQDRAAYAGDPLNALPQHAQEISLKGISTTVLQVYPGIKGGMYLTASDKVMGYAYPTAALQAESTASLSKEEKTLIRLLAARSAETSEIVTQDEWWDRDLAVGAAVRANDTIIWTMRRVPVLRLPLIGANHWLLVALVLSTILGVGGMISIWYVLHSGVKAIQRGLRRLEDDFSFRLPSIRGDLGQVAVDINRMAERRMALEEKLRQQDRLAALGKVVSGVAHEVRNPLNSIKLTLQLLDRRLKKGIATSTEVQECLQEIDRLDMIVSRLLAFGRPAMTNRHTQNLELIIAKAVKMVHEPMQSKNVRIDIGALENNLVADIDGPQIIQVLINLLLNAVEASPVDGAVQLTAGMSGSNLRIQIKDFGSRIPEDVRPHVFDAYYTTKPTGSGLGLSVSREIAANHGGSLEFESDEFGTIFTLILPAKRTADNAT
jgi:two-component system, NtrC family, sensor histidine kinase HydH